jgi:putative endonuclease
MKVPTVYILTNQTNSVLYIGVTSNLVQRVYQHKNNLVEGFTKKYKVHKLVYFEQFEDMYAAIAREKALKKWNRGWKDRLINGMNPNWRDLWGEII